MPKTTKHLESTKWKKGQSGNPLGGQAHDPITKALRKLTLPKYREVIELVLTGKFPELKEMAMDTEGDSLQIGLARAFVKAIKNGDISVIERLAERIIGKIPDELNVNSNNNTVINSTAIRIDNETLKLALQKLEKDV